MAKIFSRIWKVGPSSPWSRNPMVISFVNEAVPRPVELSRGRP